MSIDAPQLPELTTRQEKILSMIVRAYTQKAEPVTSKLLADSADMSFSAATVRNEMAVLQKLGYINAPHSSAGRVPTEQGYRYFVRQIINATDLATSEQRHIQERLSTLPMGSEQWMRLAATVLSRTAHTASLVTSPVSETSRFKHVELVAIQGRLVLMVLVLDGGTVHQRMLTLADPIGQSTLTETAARINALCVDLYANQIRMKSVQLPLLDREVTELAVEVMERADSSQVRVVYRDGLSDSISHFQDGEGTQQMIRIFEERAFLEMILSELLDPLIEDENIRVIVAGDGRWDELSQLSMVLGRYGVPGQISGAVGVIGPTHINYGRAISSVRYVSSLMTNMMIKLYTDNGDAAEDDAEPGDAP